MHFRILASLFLGFGFSANLIGSPVVEREVRLVADAEAGTTAAVQIQKAFGKKALESPDLYRENHPGEAHIRIEKAAEVGACFKFLLHRDHDGDRLTSKARSDRQRNEIKGYAGSGEALQATHG